MCWLWLLYGVQFELNELKVCGMREPGRESEVNAQRCDGVLVSQRAPLIHSWRQDTPSSCTPMETENVSLRTSWIRGFVDSRIHSRIRGDLFLEGPNNRGYPDI